MPDLVFSGGRLEIHAGSGPSTQVYTLNNGQLRWDSTATVTPSYVTATIGGRALYLEAAHLDRLKIERHHGTGRGALSGKKRKAAIEAIQVACRAYITGPLLSTLVNLIAEDTNGQGRIEIDPADDTGQTLLIWYPWVDGADTGYVQAAVKIESGAKSALDPNSPQTISPYISDDVMGINLAVPDVRTIDAERTFWDKVIILHGLRN